MRELKINFCDFWRDFDKADNYFWHLLSKRFKLRLSEDPDFLIYSAYGREHRKHSCVRIFYTSENVRPDFWECDFAFSFDYGNTSKHFRLPLYVLYDDVSKLTYPKDIDSIVASKRKFCNFLYSNSAAKERVTFFEKLSRYKTIDSGGRVMNNLGYEVNDKLLFIRDYKFTIAFENASYSGYTTEKIFHPMLVNSIPIYWGNPLVGNDFNHKSFVNVHDFKSFDEAIERIVEIDRSEDLYRQYLQQPYFHGGVVPEEITEVKILDRFQQILSLTVDDLNSHRQLKQKVSFLKKDAKFYLGVVKKRVLKRI